MPYFRLTVIWANDCLNEQRATGITQDGLVQKGRTPHGTVVGLPPGSVNDPKPLCPFKLSAV